MKTKTLLLAFILSLSYTFSYAQKIHVNRVDPPSWWTGMHDSNLQLLIFGPKISETHAIIDYPGIRLAETIHVASPDYLFLNLVISPKTKPGTFTIHFKKGKKEVTSYAYTLNKRVKNPNFIRVLTIRM